MTAIVDTRIGIYHPAPRKGSTYPRTMPALAGALGRWPDVYSTFIDLSHDYTGKSGSTAPHVDIEQAITVDGMDVLFALQPAIGYWNRGDGVYVPRWATFADIIAGVHDAALTAIFSHYASLHKPDASYPWLDTRPIWEPNVYFSSWFPEDSPQKPNNLKAVGSVGTGPTATMETTLVSGVPSYVGTWTNDAGDPVCASIAEYKACFAHLNTLLTGLSPKIRTWYVPGQNDGRAEMDRGAAGCTAANMYPGSSACYGVGYDIYNGLQAQWTTPLETLRGIRLNDLDDALASTKSITITRGTGAQTGYAYAYDMFAAIAPGKTILIGEVNSCEPGDPKGAATFGAGQSKAAWYRDLWRLGDVLPNLHTICFFNSPGTRTTYPIDSSSAAFDAFVDGFNLGADGVQHGRVATPPDPVDGDTPADPAPEVTTTSLIIPRKGGNHRILRKVQYWFRSLIWVDPSGKLGLRATGDGTSPGLAVTSDMGNQFIPAVQITGPAVAAGIRKYLLALWEAGASVAAWQIRSDGRQVWQANVALYRSATDTLTIDSTTGGAGDAGLVVADITPKRATFSDLASALTSPGSGLVKVYSRQGAPRARTSGAELQLGRRAQHEAVHGDWEMPWDPSVSATATAGVQLVAGTAVATLVEVSSARQLSGLGLWIQAAGVTLSGCYQAAYLASDGSLLMSTSDQSAAWVSTGAKSVTTGANLTTTAASALTSNPVKVWLLAWCVSAGTAPKLLGVVGTAGNWTGQRFGTVSGMTSTPPSSISVPPTANGNAAWQAAR